MLLTALSAILLSAEPNTAPWRAETFSTSNPKGVLSLGANPAGLAWMQGWEAALEYGDDAARRPAVLLGSGPFAFGWTSSPGSMGGPREQEWILGLGFPLPGDVGVGGKAVRRSVDGASQGWSGDLGTIWRPFRYASLGWDWENVGGADATRWQGHGLAIAARPFGDPALTLGWEAWFGRAPSTTQSWNDAVHEFNGEVRPFDWLAITGRWIPEWSDAWSVGIAAQLTPHEVLYGRTSPGADGGSFQGVGLHVTENALPNSTNSVPPGSILYHVGSLSGEAGVEGLVHSTKGFAQVRDELSRIGARAEVKTLVLDLGSNPMSLTHAGQLRRLVLKLREGGKVVVAWSQDLTMSSLYVMSACNKAAISPLGTVRSRGLAIRSIYAGSALRKHGIDVQVVRTGPWKSAMEPFIADHMSDEARADLECYLHDLDSMVLGGVAEGRAIDPARLIAWVDSGSMLPSKARELRILDTLVEPQDLLEWAAPRQRAVAMAFAPSGTEEWGRPRQVAVVALEGQIVDGKGAPGMVPWGQDLHADDVVEILDQLKADRSVGAVVLRVNSPGGSVVGSERIRRAVAALDKEKPVVASFTGVAASGAYLFSLPARRIWTEPEALVGSIGVFTAKVSIGRLLDSLGLHVETVATNSDAGSTSMLSALDSSQSARIREQVQDAYRMFGGLVMSSRKLDSAGFAKIDGGRVFTGARAVGNGLADSLGTLDDAVAWVSRKAGIPAENLRWISPENDRWEQLASRLESSASTKPWARYEPLLNASGSCLWAQLPMELEGP